MQPGIEISADRTPERERLSGSTHKGRYAPRARGTNTLCVTLVVGVAMTVVQAAASAAPDQNRESGLPRLIVADATLALVARWKQELVVLRRRSPASDSVKTLSDCINELIDAITAGHDVTVQLTIAEAHEVSRIPISTLRWLCNHKGQCVGARKQGGAWYIDRSCFETFLASRDGRNAVPGVSTTAVQSPTLADRVIHRITETGADLRVEGA